MVYYVALPFIRVEDGLAPGEAVECPSGAAAIRRAQVMSANEANAGVLEAIVGNGHERRHFASDTLRRSLL